jgi:hypothetical protein
MLEAIAERVPLEQGGDGKSGSRVERVRLADGRRFVIKHVSPEGDWIMRGTHDRGRIATLARSGLLLRASGVVEHAVVAVEPEGDGWAVVMRDLGAALVRDGERLSRARSRQVLAAAAALHDAFRGMPPLELCSLADRYTFLSPATAVREGGGRDSVPALLLRGWERFAALAPADVAAAVEAVHRRPERLAGALARRPMTLIHGDLKLGNLGFIQTGPEDRVVMLDWGSQTGWAPPAVEWAWYLAINASRIDATREQVLDDARAASGRHHDEVALRLALLGALAQLGWDKALQATEDPDPTRRAWEADDLAWWCRQARLALDTWSPL